jgi:Ni,Fe-hydrogenase III component G
MNRDELIQDLQNRFKDDIIELYDKSPKRVYVEINPAAIVSVGSYIFRELEARFNIASGLDAATHLEVLYHFTIERINLLISVRVKLDRNTPEIDSLAPVFKGVNWIEREMNELLGIEFRGHPEMKRLLLSDQWPEGVYPLRQDYEEWDETAIRDRGVSWKKP